MSEDIKEEDIKEKTDKLNSVLKNVKIKKVKLTQLVPFENHPFNVPSSEDDPDMQTLISSIKEEGLLNLPIVRKLNKEHEEDEDKYQIISGHRRVQACEFLGYEKIPVSIVDITDDDATIVMISSNIQREKIDFSERVRACALMYETKKHQGKSTGKEEKSTREYVGKIWGFSPNTVQRYVELSKLSDKYLELIGKKRISIGVGIEISKMSDNTQRLIEDILSENKDLKITKKQVKEIKETTEELITREKILELLQNNNIQEDTETNETTQSEINIKFSSDELRQYFSGIENLTEENIKNIILEYLRLNRETNQAK